MAAINVRVRVGRYVDENRVYVRTNGAESPSRRSLAAAVGRVLERYGATVVSVADVAVVTESERRRQHNLPEPPAYKVVIDWVDGETEDSDEIVVTAASAAGAVSKAKAEWRRTIGKQYPTCRMCGAWLVKPDRLDALVS